MTTTTFSTTDLRDQLQAAQKRQKELAAEHAGIDQQIEEASRQAARQKAQAARNGEDLTTAAADLDVEELRRRRDSLPFELWAQKIAVAELAQDLHRAELEEAQRESERASAEFATAQREAQEAEQIRDRAYARASSAGERVNMLRRHLRDDAKNLERLEGEAPKG